MTESSNTIYRAIKRRPVAVAPIPQLTQEIYNDIINGIYDLDRNSIVLYTVVTKFIEYRYNSEVFKDIINSPAYADYLYANSNLLVNTAVTHNNLKSLDIILEFIRNKHNTCLCTKDRPKLKVSDHISIIMKNEYYEMFKYYTQKMQYTTVNRQFIKYFMVLIINGNIPMVSYIIENFDIKLEDIEPNPLIAAIQSDIGMFICLHNKYGSSPVYIEDAIHMRQPNTDIHKLIALYDNIPASIGDRILEYSCSISTVKVLKESGFVFTHDNVFDLIGVTDTWNLKHLAKIVTIPDVNEADIKMFIASGQLGIIAGLCITDHYQITVEYAKELLVYRYNEIIPYLADDVMYYVLVDCLLRYPEYVIQCMDSIRVDSAYREDIIHMLKVHDRHELLRYFE